MLDHGIVSLGVQAEIDRISAALGDTTANLEALDNDLGTIRQSIIQGSSSLEFLRSESDNLKLDAQEMKEGITRLQEANVEGALNLTREAKQRSDGAAEKVFLFMTSSLGVLYHIAAVGPPDRGEERDARRLQGPA